MMGWVKSILQDEIFIYLAHHKNLFQFYVSDGYLHYSVEGESSAIHRLFESITIHTLVQNVFR